MPSSSSLPPAATLDPLFPSSTALAATTPDALVSDAVTWTTSLLAPSTLVATGLLTTMTLDIGLPPSATEEKRVVITKQVVRFLLFTALSLEILSIFAACGMLARILHLGPTLAQQFAKQGGASSMAFLRTHFETGFLTSFVTFLQGLLQWLAAVALHLTLPRYENKAVAKLNQCISCTLATVLVLMVGIVDHQTSHGGYFGMVWRCLTLLRQGLLLQDPQRRLLFKTVTRILLGAQMVLGTQAIVETLRSNNNNSPTDNGGDERRKQRF